jgi:thiosulfate/3-mercaptopyruvate sulfurtransferase
MLSPMPPLSGLPSQRHSIKKTGSICRMRFHSNTAVLAFCIGMGCILGASGIGAAAIPASSIPAEDLVQPGDLAATLRTTSAVRPLVLQVGFRKLFDEAHIVGAEYAGPGGESDGLAMLRKRVANLPKDSPIVIYCGCCPWDHCPNIGAASSALRTLGFRNVKVLYISSDFGTDWIEKGYPVTRGG